MFRPLISALLTTSLLTACGSNSLRHASTTSVPQPAAEREATAVRLQRGTCEEPETDRAGAAPLVAAAIGVAADFAISAVTEMLRRYRDGRNASWVASGSVSELRPAALPGTFCLTVARAVLLPGGEGALNYSGQPAFELRVDLTLDALPAAPRPSPAPAPASPAAAGRSGAGAPAAGGQATSPAVALTARPYELRYAETSARVRGSGRKHVSVIVALSPQTLQPASEGAAVPDTSKATVLRLDFGRLQVGSVYDRRLLSTISAVASLSTASAHSMLTAVVVESEDPNLALNAMVSAVESNSDALSNALKATIEEAIGNDNADE